MADKFLNVKLELNSIERTMIFDITADQLDRFRQGYLNAAAGFTILEVAAYQDGIPYELFFTPESLDHSILTIKRSDLHDAG
jgi:hypothetical protein